MGIKKDEYPKTLKSEDIVGMHTRGSRYDMGCLSVLDNKDKEYLVRASTLLSSFDYAYPVFNIRKARIHYYLDSINEEETNKRNEQEGR